MSETGPRGACIGWLLVLFFSGLCASACSPTSKRGDDPEAGADGEGGAGRLDELPGGYDPRISCGDLGKKCERNGDCEGGSVCTGGYCMPNTDDTGECAASSCPASHPVCVYGTCVSGDQLACLCLHPEGRAGMPQCRSITDNPPECIGEDGLCDATPNACCRGLSCVQGKNAAGEQLLGLCKKRCFEHDNCDTGCCTDSPVLADKFCAPHDACVGRCRTANEECDGDLRPCCDGFTCTASTTDPELTGCLPSCTKNSECETACCVLFQDPHGGLSDNGVCAPKDRCPDDSN